MTAYTEQPPVGNFLSVFNFAAAYDSVPHDVLLRKLDRSPLAGAKSAKRNDR
jgi:hypothetical protein